MIVTEIEVILVAPHDPGKFIFRHRIPPEVFDNFADLPDRREEVIRSNEEIDNKGTCLIQDCQVRLDIVGQAERFAQTQHQPGGNPS